jgi:signal transduction histidine kinase
MASGTTGHRSRYLVLGTEVTGRRVAEARLRHQTALARIGELVALVAHQVRNPIAGVGAGLQVLAARPALTPGDRAVIEQMRTRLDALGARVTDLVQFTRIRNPTMGRVCLRSVLEEVLASGRGDAMGPASALEGPEMVVAGDRGLLVEAFGYIVDNARQAAGPAGRVVVSLLGVNGAAEVHIRDNGPGIAPALLERVFEPLFTTTGGTGLGLSIAKQLVELHAGSVDIAETSVSGTVVRVRLPHVDQADG